MPAILTPALALRYLRELSTDVRAAAVLGADGATLAGDEALAAPAAALDAALAPHAAPGDLGALVRAPDGAAVLARAGALRLALAVGPHALVPLLLHDVADVAAGLLDAPAQARPDAPETPSSPDAPVLLIGPDGALRRLDAPDSAVRAAISAAMDMRPSAAAPRGRR